MKCLRKHRCWSSDRTGSRGGDSVLCMVFQERGSVFVSEDETTWAPYARDAVVFWRDSITVVLRNPRARSGAS
jgi:hypothetical protein